ncbi:endoplasmic reticulum transmembrane protein 3 [[Candida] railenensis]|uniref:Endoplasmic reticulum transmembrane protein n=1 Tax=[Candida] railenensis TaxID=45579 RepID=A0A9P0QUF7_9ASCO|nr:endoplasmic reticulum transmembrane protein 3 [[Candida] railenensis]
MALYYNLVFGILVFEMIFFTVLSLPYPRKIRRTVLMTVSAPFQNEQFQIALKCVLGFILVLFIDSVNRVYTVTAELHSTAGQQAALSGMVNDRSEVQARRFYAQRNMYLCGFTLFLTLILSRTYSLVAELIITKDKLDLVKGNSDLKTGAKGGDSAEIAELKKELAKKDEDLEILKEQASGLSSDYEAISNTAKPRF